MHDRDRKQPGSPLLPALDAEPGPMPPLSAAEADAIAWGAVSRWAAGLPGVEPTDDDVGPAKPLSNDHAEHLARRVVALRTARLRSSHLPPWAAKAAGVFLACGITAVSMAAYQLWPAAQRPRVTKATTTTTPNVLPPTAAQPEHRDVPAAQPTALTPKLRPVLEDAIAPEELLARANGLRAQRRWAAAERLYRQALGAGASSEQRYVALVASASINLQHLGKPARALTSYQSALALMPQADLSEEARFGSAECQHALGNRAAEKRAWELFIAEHPQSPLLDVAQQRLAALALQP